MLKCEQIDPLVTPFVDGELPAGERRLVEDHLGACPPCYSRVAAERAVRALIRARKPTLCRVEAPVAVHLRCAAFARADDPAKRNPGQTAPSATAERPAAMQHGQPAIPDPQSTNANRPSGITRAPSARPSMSRLGPFALAASLVVIVGGAFVYQATDRSARVLAAELTADHVKCFAMNSALGTQQVPTTVERTMAASFGWPMHLPDDPARAGLELVGARPCLYGEGRVAHIMYRHAGRPVSLFMLPNTARTNELVKVLGHEAAIWSLGNRTFVLVAREPRPEVERMMSFVQASMH
jgi:anti-sigma factor RsiW